MEGKHRVPMCRYFRQGKCTKGESCEFSHDLSHPDSFICPYFLLGFCKYGSRCQYDHKYPQVSQPWEPPPGKWPLSTRVESTHSEVSSVSVESAPWRPSAARSSKLPHEGLSNHRSQNSKLSKAAGPAFFAQREASAADSSPAAVSSEPDLRPICVYFQTGACQFGERCRFKHVLADNTPATSAAVATAEHAIRIAANLRNLETLPASKHRPQVLTRLNWSLACSKPASDMVRVAPVMQKSAWGNGLLVTSNPDGFPQTLPEPASQQPHGWRVLDDNVDSLDPWERSQHPSTIPLRPPAAEADAPEDLTCSDGGECMPQLEGDIPDPSEMLCSEHAMTGCCPVRDTCPCVHGDLCPSCGYHCLHPTDEEMRRAHETACRTYFEEYQRLEIMHTMECSICLEPVLQKEEPSARCFGLLDCDHCFCLQCIRGWRDNTFADVESATRTCPTCRRKTHFVTPSTIWPATEEEKDVIVEAYKQQLQEKHCKHFDHGRGTCPFGTSCFYRHEYLDGSLQDRSQLPDVRFVTNSDGEFTTVRENTLASLLDAARSSNHSRNVRRVVH